MEEKTASPREKAPYCDEDFDLSQYAKTTSAVGFLENLKRKAMVNGLAPLTVGASSAAVEYTASTDSELIQWQMMPEVRRGRPENSDLLIIIGAIPRKTLNKVKRLYDRMPHPKWVMVVGTEACAPQIFPKYTLDSNIFSLIPVDVYVPGNPPGQEAILEGLEKVSERVRLGVSSSEIN